jgi:hypothetical protein
VKKRVHGYKKAGEPMTTAAIEQFASDAERQDEPDQLKGARRGRGRPPLGDAAKVVSSLRLDPALRRDAEQRATVEGITMSELVRRALREYL